MSFTEQIIDRFDRAYSITPIIIGDNSNLETALSKAYIALWVYNEPYRTECILDGLYQRFGYPSLAP